MRLKISVLILLFLFSGTFLSFSQILKKVSLFDTLKKSDKEESTFFDIDKNWIYFNLEFDNNIQQDSLELIVEISKKSNVQHQLKPFLSKNILITKPFSGVVMDSLDITKGLFSGNFVFTVKVQHLRQNLQTLSTWFQTLRPLGNQPVKQEFVETTTTGVSDEDITHSFVGKYDLKQIQHNVAALLPIAHGGEIIFIRNNKDNTDLTLLKRFFYSFWTNRFPTEPEKGWKEYAEKLNTVAKLFGYSGEKGYETDRGKVYLNYGKPDRYEKLPSEKNTRPYEIWFYYNANGRRDVKFLFYQPGVMANQYMLLHSSESDEMVNPNWKQFLFLGSEIDQTDRSKHRVLEYFQ